MSNSDFHESEEPSGVKLNNFISRESPLLSNLEFL